MCQRELLFYSESSEVNGFEKKLWVHAIADDLWIIFVNPNNPTDEPVRLASDLPRLHRLGVPCTVQLRMHDIIIIEQKWVIQRWL